jgi:hypothetical protein
MVLRAPYAAKKLTTQRLKRKTYSNLYQNQSTKTTNPILAITIDCTIHKKVCTCISNNQLCYPTCFFCVRLSERPLTVGTSE